LKTVATQSRIKKNSIPVRKKVYEHMKSAILSGRLNPAERLREEHLGEMMGVSRTRVREQCVTTSSRPKRMPCKPL
jgi:DNA-binding GntR family transcriptional regulator